MTKPTTIDAGTIEALELVFVRSLFNPQDTRRYLLYADDSSYLDALTRFPANEISRTKHYYIDDTEGKWFAFYNVDCFDPPYAVIRARTFEAAYEAFCDEFERWMKVDEADAKDYPEDERNYNSSGTHIDTDNVQGHELFLISVRVA